jgi:hypothetical protein
MRLSSAQTERPKSVKAVAKINKSHQPQITRLWGSHDAP